MTVVWRVLINEIKKLIDFCDEEIYKTDIDRVVSKSMEVIVFELTDAIMLGNTQKAMETLAAFKNGQRKCVYAYIFNAFDI